MRLQAEAKSQYEAYERSSAEIRAESEKLERERRLILDELDPDVLGCYESARKRFGGIAVESLVGNKPTVCRVALQPSSYSDLRRLGKTIAECPYCHRMLVIQPAED